MKLIESIARSLNAPGPHRDGLLKSAGARRKRLKKAGFDLFEASVSEQPDQGADGTHDRDLGLKRWDGSWASLAWQQLFTVTEPQSQPIALIISLQHTDLSTVVCEASLRWFADRGNAVLVDDRELVTLHPCWHFSLADRTSTRWINSSAQRLGGLLIADAVKQNRHLVIALATEEHSQWVPLAKSLDQNGYRCLAILEKPVTLAAQSSVRQCKQELLSTGVIVEDIVPPSNLSSASKTDADSAVAPSKAANPSKGPTLDHRERTVALGTFTARTAVQANETSAAEPRHSAPKKPAVAINIHGPKKTPVQPPAFPNGNEQKPIVPTTVGSSAEVERPTPTSSASVAPRGNQQAVSATPASESDSRLQRLREMQQNIRRKANG